MWSRPDTPGQYAFFNAANCPAGWIAANGANGTVDLRGEFIRGWDNGRGVDSGRSLAGWQKGTLVVSNEFFGDGELYGLSTNAGSSNPVIGAQYMGADTLNNPAIYPSTEIEMHYSGGSRGGPTSAYTSSWGVSRPRNVALLACMKL